MSLSLDSILQEISSQQKAALPEDLEELSLDSLEITEITPELQKELEKFPNLLSLTLNECSLTSLANFPSLPNLTRLELCDNSLTSSCVPVLSGLKSLQSLSLGGNNFKAIAELEPLKSLENLTDLDLLGCELCLQENYRAKLFELLPKLLIIDNFDRDGNDLDASLEEKEEKLAKILLTKEVIIVSSDEDSETEQKKPQNAEDYFRKVVFHEKFKEKCETFAVNAGLKKPRSQENDQPGDEVKKKLKI